ncbi:cytochrome C assembly family protein [Chitinimonas koreensis]|uniref:cytochrome C assembly family protein n=1 Tax=Chitinimonas koreensis TaxID=356302 RepID=UPI00041CE739|nr:cytochrome c biogenesis protein CcsA [Chitinimonas koreensis]QNM97204.1 cytochrome c biogenesis protein CcsA [Chitinimonas koreensis]
MPTSFPPYSIAIWLGYALLACWLSYRRRQPLDATSTGEQRSQHLALGLLLLAHAPLVFLPVAGPVPHFGAREALGLLTWLAVLIYWTAAFLIRLDGLQTVLLPVAAVSLGISLLLPGGHATPWLAAPLMQAHFAIAMLAYGFFAVAAGLALLMRLADRQLHQPARGLLRQLPPLLALERLLFSTLTLGFVLLTLTLLTGAVFSEELFGRPLSFNHKTVFSLTAWAVFAILLWGRRTRGWRGRIAVNWTLAGFALLLLAYIGSRFVLDTVLRHAAGQ